MNIVVNVLAVFGALSLIAVLGMLLMHGTMMCGQMKRTSIHHVSAV